MSAENAVPATKRAVTMEKLVNLCKRRGIVFPTSDIYGGLGSTFDYGPLGVELKRNVKEAWWREMVQYRSDVLGLDSAIFQHPRTWEASGHLKNFTDPMVDCKACKNRFRADKIQGDKCPDCGGELTPARNFNLMFKTFMGPVEDTAAVVYLRPETAQGIFSNFENIVDTQRVKLPFGVAQMGKSFRNEITTENFIFRTREFEQMEMEYFVRPDREEEEKWYRYWVDFRFNWHLKFGIKRDHLRARQHATDELSHYSRGTTDIEFLYPFGWGELEGVAKRGSFDLDQHAKFSGKDLTYFDEDSEDAFSAVGYRARARSRSRDAGVHARCVRRGRGRERGANRAAARSAARADQGGGLSAAAQSGAARESNRDSRCVEAALYGRLRSSGLDRPALSPSG